MKRIAKKTAVILWLVLKTTFFILHDIFWFTVKITFYAWVISELAGKNQKGKS